MDVCWCFCYVDDLVLYAPCASALCKMLSICSSYANSHTLLFNESKSQLENLLHFAMILFHLNGVTLLYSSSINHLGHVLSFNLKDHDDIIRVVKDMNRKANCILHNFCSADPHILCLLFKSFCLLLYGCVLQSLSSSSSKILQFAINKILRKIWHLPHLSHTSIVLSVAKIDFIHNIVYNRFLTHILCSPIFLLSSVLPQTFFSVLFLSLCVSIPKMYILLI